MRGPTPWCNWAIKGQVIAGAFPASLDDDETDNILSLLLGLGITTFVCLQSEFSLDATEHEWRSGRALRPYIHDAQRVLRMAYESGNPRIRQRKIDFLHLSIDDGGITSDQAMDRLADDCCNRVRNGEKLYIHCWGGHGRTGTLVAVMLGRLYNITYAAALHCTQTFHDARRFPQGVRSPSTAVQRAQVRRLLAPGGLPGSSSSLSGVCAGTNAPRATGPQGVERQRSGAAPVTARLVNGPAYTGQRTTRARQSSKRETPAQTVPDAQTQGDRVSQGAGMARSIARPALRNCTCIPPGTIRGGNAGAPVNAESVAGRSGPVSMDRAAEAVAPSTSRVVEGPRRQSSTPRTDLSLSGGRPSATSTTRASSVSDRMNRISQSIESLRGLSLGGKAMQPGGRGDMVAVGLGSGRGGLTSR